MTDHHDEFLARLRSLYEGETPSPAPKATDEARRVLLEAVTGFRTRFITGPGGEAIGAVATGIPYQGAGSRAPLTLTIKFSEE